MKLLYQADLDETLYYEKLKNGLEIYYFPNQLYSQVYGLIHVNFGSNDLDYMKDGKQTNILPGIAHFLEHKMFDSSLGDYGERFASLGAEANAYTTFYRTCYDFYASSNIYECTCLLLDMVQSLEITKESVEKEKGIIIEEIHGEDDNPVYQCYDHMIKNLYKDHPLKIDIGGNDESVNATTKEMLEEVYDTFYHPNNMSLFLSGNFDLIELSNCIHQHQDRKIFNNLQPITRVYHQEDLDHHKEYEIVEMDSHTEYCCIGYKLPFFKDPKEYLKHRVAMNMFCDLLFSKSSFYYQYLKEKGIINDTFSYQYSTNYDYSYLSLELSGEQVDQLINEMHLFNQKINDLSFSSESVDIIRKMNIGSMIANLGTLSAPVRLWEKDLELSVNLFEQLELYKNISYDEIIECKKWFVEESMSICKVL